MNVFSKLKVKTNDDNGKGNRVLPYTIPPLYQLFLNTFDVDSNQSIGEMYIDPKYGNVKLFDLNENQSTGEKFTHPKYGIVNHFGFRFKHNDMDISISDFFNEKELCEYSIYLDSTYLYDDLKLVPIGDVVCGGIYIGVDASKNLDQIFIYFWGGGRLIYCANNIFEFCSKLSLNTDRFENLQTPHFYKNFHENYWRVKPPELRDVRPLQHLDKDSLDKTYLDFKEHYADLFELEYEYNIRGIKWSEKTFWNKITHKFYKIIR